MLCWCHFRAEAIESSSKRLFSLAFLSTGPYQRRQAPRPSQQLRGPICISFTPAFAHASDRPARHCWRVPTLDWFTGTSRFLRGAKRRKRRVVLVVCVASSPRNSSARPPPFGVCLRSFELTSRLSKLRVETDRRKDSGAEEEPPNKSSGGCYCTNPLVQLALGFRFVSGWLPTLRHQAPTRSNERSEMMAS